MVIILALITILRNNATYSNFTNLIADVTAGQNIILTFIFNLALAILILEEKFMLIGTEMEILLIMVSIYQT